MDLVRSCEVLGGTSWFNTFRSVFSRRGAAPGVSLGDFLADLVGNLGPHMLCTPMGGNQESLEVSLYTLGGGWGSLGVLGGHQEVLFESHLVP